MSVSRLERLALVLLSATTLAVIGPLQDPASADLDQPRHATGQVSVMLRDGVLEWPQGIATSRLDALAFADSHLDSLLHAGGVATVEKLFKSFAPDDTLKTARDGLLVRVLDLSQIYVLHTSGEDFSDPFIERLAAARGVLFAERMPAASLPFSWSDPPADDPRLLDDQQWGLFNLGLYPDHVRHADIDIKRAWQIQTGRPDVLLGVIDTGICYDHPDLSPSPFDECYVEPGCKVVGGWNAVWPESPPYDDCYAYWSGHGTAVAAVAAGLTNNVQLPGWDGGVAGVAGGRYAGVPGESRGVSLLAYTGIGEYPVSYAAQSVEHATGAGAHVTNHSYGWRGPVSWCKPLWYARINAYLQGIVQVASMGNAGLVDDPENPFFPASAEQGVIAVGATSFNDHRVTIPPDGSWQSCYGPHIDVVAPGIAHYSATPLDPYCGGPPYVSEFGGTSCSAPIVSGIAALLLSEEPSLSNEEVAGIICASAKDLVYQDAIHETYSYPGWDEETGWGRVDAFQALMRLRSPYRRQVKFELGFDDLEETGITYIFGPEGDRDKLVQWRITKEVPIEFGWFTGTPDVWGLSRMSSGACSLLTGPGDGGRVAAEFVMGCCKIVKGSETGSTCTLKSFLYAWSNETPSGQWVYQGWLPNDPGCHGWRYEVLGNVLDPLVSTSEMVAVTAAQDGVPCFCPAGDLDSLGVSLHLVDNLGGSLEGVPSTDINVRVHGDERTAHPARFPCEADAESLFVYRAEEFVESDADGDLFLDLPPMGGHDRWARWTVHVSGKVTGAQVLEQGVRSVDIDGDGDVDMQDLVLFGQGLQTGSWFVDFNGDGSCNMQDFVVFGQHFGHGCGTRGRGGREELPEGGGGKLAWFVLPSTPNPFSRTTDVAFCVPEAGQRVRISVYDLAGRLTQTLCDTEYDAGIHTVTWDGRNSRGERVASGVYFFEVTAPGFRDRGKMMLLR